MSKINFGLKEGDICKLKNNNNYAKIIKILKPKESPNPHNYKIAECEFSTDKCFTFGIIKYFKLRDLKKI